MNIIFSKFLSLKPEKRERILNAAMKEFTQKGFESASTNEIVKEASISKGLLFHYFKNKKDLFLFLYNYLLEIYLNEFFGKINWSDQDIFIRLKQMLLLKLELLKKYPEMFNFIKAAYFEESVEIKNDLGSRNKELIAESYNKLFADIDISKFREEVDIKRGINIIVWTLEGYSAQEEGKIKLLALDQINYEEMLEEIDNYFDLLKRFLYKS